MPQVLSFIALRVPNAPALCSQIHPRPTRSDHADPQPQTLGLARAMQVAAFAVGSVSSGNQRWQHLQPQSQPLARQHLLQQ